MDRQALIEIDNVEFIASLLRDLARAHKRGRMEITPAAARELVALAVVAKRVIIACISVPVQPPAKGGDAAKTARGDSVLRKI